MMKRILKYSGTLILILSLYLVKAQEFKWQSSIEKVNSKGFYKILLSPEIVSKLKTNFEDIRLFDEKNTEVPFIIESENPIEYKDYFVEYQIIENKDLAVWPFYSRLVIHNPKKNDISNLNLIIRNSDVRKSLKLSGSDDNKKWYSIKDNYRFYSLYSDESSSVIKIIDFPVSNYEYYEILIDNWKNNPLNIIKAGYYNTSVEKGKYSEIEKPLISQSELKADKQSLVKIVYPEKSRIDKITFKVDGPEFYYREAEIQIRDSILNKRNKYEFSFQTVSTIVISSNSLNTFYFDNLYTDEIYLKINNYDDSALKIIEVQSEQLNHYLICNLDESNIYNLKFGNQELVAANYDLKYFKDKIPEQLPVLKSSEVKSLIDSTIKNKSGFILDKKFIWVAIFLVVVFLIYMISKMMKELNTQKKNEN